MLIREMTEDDLDQVADLEAKNFSVPWHRESFAEILNNSAALYMVVEEDEKIIGTCGIITALDEGDICNVVTDEHYRGRGIGYELVSKVMEQAYARFGTTRFTLEVRVGNEPAINLYKKLGFESAGVRPRFYEKPVEDALIMWKTPSES